jgi:hypothetical protein
LIESFPLSYFSFEFGFDRGSMVEMLWATGIEFLYGLALSFLARILHKRYL